MTTLDHVFYALAWLSFGALHSLLARERGQALLARGFGAGTRLAYNVIAVLHIGAIWAFGFYLGLGAKDFPLPPIISAGLFLLALAGLVLLYIAVREFDLARFSGFWQLLNRVPPGAEGEHEPLVTGGLHRYVRHPLYTAGFMILWGVVDDPRSLATALYGSLYLLIGTYFEERKLRRIYGRAYEDYSRRVPPFIPWPRPKS